MDAKLNARLRKMLNLIVLVGMVISIGFGTAGSPAYARAAQTGLPVASTTGAITMNADQSISADSVSHRIFLPLVSVGFNKLGPANGASNLPVNLTLNWEASSDATAGYNYCIESIIDDYCNGYWIYVGTDTSVTLNNLHAGATYYWQVRALNSSGSIDADAGAWWSFTTIAMPPAAFGKLSPANAAIDQSFLVPDGLILRWKKSMAVTYYEYCLDTINNDSCDTSWYQPSYSDLSDLERVIFSYGFITPLTTYYWQIRAVNDFGTTYADGGAWWSFTTKGVLPKDFIKGNPFIVPTYMPPNPYLDWFSSEFADNYDYCLDTINNDICDTTWVRAVVINSGTDVRTALSGLAPNTTYYWQVRANNISGTTYADNGYWKPFTTWWSPTPGRWQSQSGNVLFYVRPDRLTVTNFRIQVNLPGCGTYWFSVPSPAGDMKAKVDDSATSYEFIPNGNGIKPHGYIYSSSAAYGSVVLDHAGPICDKYWSSVPLGWTATWQNNTQPSSLMLAPDGPIFLKADPGIITPFTAIPDN